MHVSVCVCVCVDVDVGGRPFPRVYVPWVYVCLRGEWRGWLCVIYSSVVARCEKDDESFRLPFSNRLDSTGHQAKGKLLYGASALCPIDLCASLLIENHRTGFSFRSDRSIADSSYSESNVSNHSPFVTRTAGSFSRLFSTTNEMWNFIHYISTDSVSVENWKTFFL